MKKLIAPLISGLSTASACARPTVALAASGAATSTSAVASDKATAKAGRQ